MTAKKASKPTKDARDEAVLQQVAMQLINAIISRASLQCGGGVGDVIADLRRQLGDVQMECAEIAAELNSGGN